MSVVKMVGAGDEWAAEAYLETDYSLVTDALFRKTLHRYSTYLFSNEQRTQVSIDQAEGRLPSILTRLL